VAIRWSHITIVAYLLENIEWSKEDIKRALKISKESQNKTIEKTL